MDAHFEAALLEKVCQGFRHHDGTMPSTRAADGDSEIAFALPNVKRKRICNNIEKLFAKQFGLRRSQHITSHRRVAPGFSPEVRLVIRIRHKTDIPDQIRIDWQAVFITERYNAQ